MSTENIITTKEKDYLETDDQIRNQNFCCLSFISPEDVLVQKETFMFSKFCQKFSTDLSCLIDNLKLKYKDDTQLIDNIKNNHSYLFDYKEMDEQFKFYKDSNSLTLEDDFHKSQDFNTSIRGIKVRGVFNSVDEARTHCNKLKIKDPNFNIYVAEVGCWVPWSPNPCDIKDQEWSETQLNTLMMNYNKNKEDKDMVFNERSTKIHTSGIVDDTQMAAGAKIDEEVDEIAEAGAKMNVFEEDDPWLKQKNK